MFEPLNPFTKGTFTQRHPFRLKWYITNNFIHTISKKRLNLKLNLFVMHGFSLKKLKNDLHGKIHRAKNFFDFFCSHSRCVISPIHHPLKKHSQIVLLLLLPYFFLSPFYKFLYEILQNKALDLH